VYHTVHEAGRIQFRSLLQKRSKNTPCHSKSIAGLSINFMQQIVIFKRNTIQETHQNSEDEIGERYRLNHAIVEKLCHPYSQFPCNVRLSYR